MLLRMSQCSENQIRVTLKLYLLICLRIERSTTRQMGLEKMEKQ